MFNVTPQDIIKLPNGKYLKLDSNGELSPVSVFLGPPMTAKKLSLKYPNENDLKGVIIEIQADTGCFTAGTLGVITNCDYSSAPIRLMDKSSALTGWIRHSDKVRVLQVAPGSKNMTAIEITRKYGSDAVDLKLRVVSNAGTVGDDSYLQPGTLLDVVLAEGRDYPGRLPLCVRTEDRAHNSWIRNEVILEIVGEN